MGHLTVLLGTVYTLIGLVTFSSRSKSYYISYTGAILSWGIVVVSTSPAPTGPVSSQPDVCLSFPVQYKSLGTPQLNKAYIQRALLDENVQYLLLALYWYLQKPIYITLIPFATFSLFHTRKCRLLAQEPSVHYTCSGTDTLSCRSDVPPDDCAAQACRGHSRRRRSQACASYWPLPDHPGA